MTSNPCPLCHRRACDCNARHAPFHVVNRNGNSMGSPATVDVLVSIMSLVETLGLGPGKAFTRQGLPVNISPAKPASQCLTNT